MPKEEALKPLLDKYLHHVRDVVGLEYYTKKDEGYKFDFVSNFQKNFDLKVANLKEMLERAIKSTNLVVGNRFFPLKMLLILAEEYESEVRKSLENLFNEKVDVANRIDKFEQEMEDLTERRNKRLGSDYSSFIGLRFTSLLLSSRYPTKYYAIKPSEYKRFIKIKDGKIESFKGLSSGEKYEILEKHADEVRTFIKDIPEIQEIHTLMIKDRDFKDQEFRWMTQDFMYTAGRKEPEQETEEDLEYPQETESVKESPNPKEVDVLEFLDSVKSDEYQYEPCELDPPSRLKVRPIIEACSSGKFVLPNFQRYFDWKEKDVKDFFESIFDGYYVGAFLFWDTGYEPPLDVIPIKGVDISKENIKPEKIILDGQQRITSIYYGIKAPGFKLRGNSQPSYFYIDINSFLIPNKDKTNEVTIALPIKLNRKESYKRFLFPLYELEKYDEWVDGFEDFILEKSSDNDKIRQIRRIIDKRLKYMWEGFEIPYITLPKSMELVQATEIFEKLNTRGKLLSVFDLLIARMYKYGVSLRELWDEIKEKYPDTIKRYYSYTEKIPIYILQAMTLCFSSAGSCKRKDILDMYENVYEGTDLSFEEHWDEMSGYLDSAIKMLENLRADGFGVKSEKEMPFEPMIPILAALLKEINSSGGVADCYKKLKMWYWASVFSNAYSQAADSRMTADFKEMKTWFSNDSQITKSVIEARRSLPYLDLKETQYKTGSIYRGVMSLMAIEGSKDFNTGLSLENARSNDKDHIYPKAVFSFLGGHIHSVLNIAWMSGDTNRKIKRFKKPSEYIKEFIREKYGDNEEEFLKVLETHFINKRAYENLLKNEDGFEAFLEERQKVIMSKIKDILGIESSEVEPGLITPEDPFRNTIMFGEVIQSCEEYLNWVDKYFSLKGLTLLSQFLNKDKVKDLKIIMSVDKVDGGFRNLFKEFREGMKNREVHCELRVITDPGLKSQIHDRWIISKDACFNIPSPDIVARGQYSEIKKTQNIPPFEEWWQNSKDIITEWGTIENFIK